MAQNIVAELRGSQPRPFAYTPVGELALVGRHSGVARIYGHNFSGPLAWIMWRTTYLAKMPGAIQRSRIFGDWLTDLLVGRATISCAATPERGKMTSNERYEVIIIGTGAGGGTLAYHLANAGKRVLILERGSFLPQEKPNWDTTAVFLDNRYHTKDVWTDKDGKALHPGTGYWVGGNTKVYGAALFRLREEDFGVLHHKGGISPGWPVKYDVFEPYYTQGRRAVLCARKTGHRSNRTAPQRTNIPIRRSPTNRACRRFRTICRRWACSPFPARSA